MAASANVNLVTKLCKIFLISLKMGDQDFTEERTKVFETEEIIDGKNVKKKNFTNKN